MSDRNATPLPASREAVADSYRELSQAQRRAAAAEEAKRRALLREERRMILVVTGPKFEALEARIQELEGRVRRLEDGA